eukprot:scaffold4498_cov119-Isochrysis_galbana.AAC.19
MGRWLKATESQHNHTTGRKAQKIRQPCLPRRKTTRPPLLADAVIPLARITRQSPHPPTQAVSATQTLSTPSRSEENATTNCARPQPSGQKTDSTPTVAILTTATLTKCPTLTPPLPPHSQGKNKPPPRPPPIAEEAMEEGDDPNFVSDTNNLITIKQKAEGPYAPRNPRHGHGRGHYLPTPRP